VDERRWRGRRARGLPLGALELAVLDRLWSAGSADVGQMHAAVGAPRRLASNTIQTTLERLVRKGLAEREKIGRAFRYRPRVSRAEWLTAALGELLDGTPGADASLALSAFVDLTERTGEANLAALEELVRRRRREREGGA
jgi:predicted transcriptional regulator